MVKPPIQTEPIQNVPEVLMYEQAKAQLQQFIQQYQQVFDAYQQLQEQYNTTLESAVKTVRSLGVSCGDIELFQRNDKIDETGLYESVTREDFLDMGGSTTTTLKVKVDKRRFMTKHAQGDVSQELYDSVVSYEDKYHTPPKLVGP